MPSRFSASAVCHRVLYGLLSPRQEIKCLLPEIRLAIISAHLRDLALAIQRYPFRPGGDGDVPMTGTEKNEAVLAGITALQNAYAALPA